MKILHTGDWHVGSFSGPETGGENARFLDICKCLDNLTATAAAESPDFIIVAGDVFHQAKIWADRGLKENRTVIRHIRLLENIAPVVVVRGTPNHDSEQQYEMLKSAFEGDDGVWIFTEPTVAKIYSYHGEKLQIAALPGFDRGVYRAKHPGLSKEEENEIFTEELANIILGLKASCDTEIPAVLVSHYTIPGCNMESGQTQFFSQFEPVIYPATLQAADFDLVCFGHIHRPQQIEGPRNTFYCGAISALNFNDEGQDRGFYIHRIDGIGGEAHSEFHATPSRQFHTLRMNDEQIAAFNSDEKQLGSSEDLSDVDGKIVRVLYNCTDEHNKALNKTLMEQKLYALGAFWVQEITPEKITVTVGKNALSDANSPEDNLRDYLAEKEYEPERVARIVEAATPIIAEAAESNMTEAKTGMFTPVEIEVKNYRNYREETFSFDGIRFCTINGANGVGKSSLFMDAIADALFEETREDDIAGWICNDEAARSGAIKFTFRLGERLYRVTRTRQKSGKATLNIAEKVDGEWVDRSKEKYKDTQAEILNIIGMDSLTLKATALIMQDRYGLFLQADKEARMAILGNILGLGIYGDMEEIASANLAEENRILRTIADNVTHITAALPDADALDAQIDEKTAAIEALRKAAAAKTAEADGTKVRLNTLLEAGERAMKLQGGIASLIGRKTRLESDKTTQAATIFQADSILEKAAEIAAGVAEYNALLEIEKQALSDRKELDMFAGQKAAYETQIEHAQSTLNRLNAEEATLKERIAALRTHIGNEAEYAKRHADLSAHTAEIAEIKAHYTAHIELEKAVRTAETALAKLTPEREHGETARRQTLATLEAKTKLLADSECIDSENAKCRFLADALAAKAQIPTAEYDLAVYETESAKILADASECLRAARDALADTKYNVSRLNELEAICDGIRPYERLYTQLEQQKEQLSDAEKRLASIAAERGENEKQFNDGCDALAEIDDKLKAAQAAAAKHADLAANLEAAKAWVEKEKMLPVAEERKQAAAARILEIDGEIAEVAAELEEKNADLAKEKLASQGADELKRQTAAVDAEIAAIQREGDGQAIALGGLQKQREQADEAREQAKELQKSADEHSRRAVTYGELKKAFSQDGIPHNIIRSIIPILEATATNILGQMSGGKMSVEFITEKMLKSNSKKEVTTLDIIINDSDTGRLAYMSRSGGERVKAALSVILALSEIKSTKAGVQLGFLFIDEPPFLDAPGVQAYCDALEAIQNRYADLKVMAITHDPAMKSRFPQSVDIIKTPDGSKVVFD